LILNWREFEAKSISFDLIVFKLVLENLCTFFVTILVDISVLVNGAFEHGSERSVGELLGKAEIFWMSEVEVTVGFKVKFHLDAILY
jgi:hypothetical protein